MIRNKTTAKVRTMLVVFLSTALLFTAIKIQPVRAQVVFVVPSAMTPTLASAVAMAVPNDEIHVLAGHFEVLPPPGINIWQNNLRIIGDPQAPMPIIEVAGNTINIVGANVFIYGLQIMDSVAVPTPAIQINPPATGCIIRGCTIIGFAPVNVGIMINNSPNNVIALNMLTMWGVCVDISGPGSVGNTIVLNTINPPIILGIQVSVFSGFNQIYWNNLMVPTELWDANPPGSPPNWFDDTSGGGPGWRKGNFEITWANPAPYLIPPGINGYVDMFPLIGPIGQITGDADLNGKVDIYDIVAACAAYGQVWCQYGWNPNVNWNGDGTINIFDVVAACANYGVHY